MGVRALSGVLLAVAALTAAAPARGADDGLVLTRSDVAGYGVVGSGAKMARTALGAKPTKSLRKATVRGAAFKAGSRQLWVGVYRTGSVKLATRALRELGKTQRVTATKKRTDATVLVRVGRAVGAVTFRIPRRDSKTAGRAARAYARALTARLERVLALTAWDRNLERIGADGSVTPQVALRAFAITYGSLPGVKRPSGPLGIPDDGNAAIDLVAGVWDRLSRAQQTAIDRLLGKRHDPTSPPLARSAKGGKLTEDPSLELATSKYVDYYRARIAGLVPSKVNVYKSELNFGPLAETTPTEFWGQNDPTGACDVVIAPKGMAYFGTPEFEYILAHEVFHCFQYTMYEGWRALWILEGMADWAAIQATNFLKGSHYRNYLKTLSMPLFQRSYSASGFWGHIDEVSGFFSLWAKIPTIFSTPDQAGAYALAGGSEFPFEATWASAPWRMKSAGSAWRQLDPYLVPIDEVPPFASVLTTDAQLLSSPFAMKQYAALGDSTRPLVEVRGNAGFLRAGTDGQDFGLITSPTWFCFAESCECPGDAITTVPPYKPVNAAVLALPLTGAAAKGVGQVSYHSIDEFCEPLEPEVPDGPAETNGDPHLTTLDGLHYDFQAAGEYVLVRSRSRDLEIQARQEPWKESRKVTVNTQLAMRVGGRRVTVSPGSEPDDVPMVRIDGAVTALPAGTVVPVGGGSVQRNAFGLNVRVTWPDGSRIDVRPVGSWGVAAQVSLAPGRSGSVSGLLGDFDGKPGDDLANRKGKAIKYTAKASDDWGYVKRYVVAEEFESKFFDALYDDVGDSWRISQAESLFDYEPGQTTKTFTDRTIPTRPVDPADVSGRANAERICRDRGVTEPGPLADCILDVASTGETDFADDALAAQETALVDWAPLRAGAGLTGDTSLLETGDGAVHVGFQNRPSPATTQAVDVPLDAAGGEGAAEPIAGAGGEPSLLAAPDGGVRALSGEIPSGAAAGMYEWARGPGGQWAGLGAVTTGGPSYLGSPSGLMLPDGTLFSVSPMAGVARVFRGAGQTNPGVAPTAALPDCFASSPALARDGVTGALWVAWVQWDCPQLGVFVQQVDTATGGLLGTPVKAPGSSWTPKSGGFETTVPTLADRLAFTGRPGQPGVYLAYATDDGTRVQLWRVGDAATKVIAKRKSAADPLLAAEPTGGRMWLAWTEPGRLLVERTTPSGAPDGALRAIPAPATDKPGAGLRHWQIAARAGALDVVLGRTLAADQPGALWHARLEP